MVHVAWKPVIEGRQYLNNIETAILKIETHKTVSHSFLVWQIGHHTNKSTQTQNAANQHPAFH